MGYLRGNNVLTPAPRSTYLRGSRKPLGVSGGGPPTLANKVRRLEYKINRLRPELKEFRSNITYAVPVGIGSLQTFTPTQDLIASPNFRDNVLGDRWRQCQLVIKLKGEDANLDTVRVMVYIPKSGAADHVPANPFRFTSMPDMSDVTVLADRLFEPSDPALTVHGTMKVPLNNVTALYDSTNTTLERGALKIMVVTASSGAVSNLFMSYSYYYSNI